MHRYLRNSLLYTIPALVVYGWLVLYPAFNAFHYSLYQWVGFGNKEFVGLGNFASLLGDEYFLLALRNTFFFVIAGTFGVVGGGLLVALLLNRITIGHGTLKTIYFLPVVMSAVAVGLLWRFIYNPDIGLLNSFIRLFGAKDYNYNWLGNRRTILAVVLLPVVWQYIGLYMVIYYAGLRSIPPSFLEAAEIDGASSFQKFRRITFPLLREVTLVCTVLASTGLLRTFDHVWAITKGGPNHASEVIAIYMWQEAFEMYRAGRAMGVAVLMFFFSIIITLGLRRIIGLESVSYAG
jgi:raffinose/stachyose/melibiose transport system permease protein